MFVIHDMEYLDMHFKLMFNNSYDINNNEPEVYVSQLKKNKMLKNKEPD